MQEEEERLIEKLRSIESLHAGAKTAGEKLAAGKARERILARLRECEKVDPPIEYQFSMPDPWKRKVFLALLRRYGIEPYRYPRQRSTTVMARVPKSFVDLRLWPQFRALSKELSVYLSAATDRVLREVLETESSEAEVRSEPPRLTE